MIRERPPFARCSASGPSRAFTLTELLVVAAIMGILMSILATTLVKVRGAAKSVICKNKLQTVTQRFRLFADDYGHTYRGPDSERLGPNRFRLQDYQDSLYGTEEFYDRTIPRFTRLRLDRARQPLLCPASPGNLWLLNSPDPARDSIRPLANVSVGFNMRLHLASVTVAAGSITIPSWRDVVLTMRALDHPWTPLAFDVDGAAAMRGHDDGAPFYSAPSLGDGGFYANNAFWFPARRHAGRVHAAFIGGHVWTSSDPAAAAGWDWHYQPPVD